MPAEHTITYMPGSEWKLPFNIAAGFHLLLILGVVYLPGLFDKKPKFADIYTVSLVNIAEPVEPVAQPEPAQEKTPVQSIKTSSVKTKKVAPIAEPVKIAEPAPQKAISIKPLKRKKVKKIVKKPKDTSSKKFDRRKIQKLAKALQNEEIAEEKAQLAQEELARERSLMKTVAKPITRPENSGQKPKAPGKTQIGGSSNLIQAQYHAAIFGKLQQFWSLPEYMQENLDLVAVVVITIKKNGQIANVFFEERSGDRVFDQFVAKTIEAASPLPAIPAAMKKQRYEIGLRFRPESIR